MSIQDTANEVDNFYNMFDSVWFWVALIELLIILVLLLIIRIKIRSKRRIAYDDLDKRKLKKKLSNSSVDMNNLMRSINESKELYKQLSRLCHPDRFVNTDKDEIANIIFQEISKNKRNFDKLNELKQKAINELGIKTE